MKQGPERIRFSSGGRSRGMRCKPHDVADTAEWQAAGARPSGCLVGRPHAEEDVDWM